MNNYNFRTNEKKIIDFLFVEENKSNGYCDDCLSHKLKIKPRQQVNQICRRLKEEGKISRIKARCILCGKEKKLNFSAGKIEELLEKSQRETSNKFQKIEGTNSKKWNYEDEWFEETNVSINIRDYLSEKGHKIIKFNIDKRQKGHDIITIKEGVKTIIEVKGYPSDKYVRGKNKGEKKPTPSNLQAKHWFSEGLLSLLLAKCDDWDITIALGLPKFRKYEELIKKIEPLKEKIGLKCYFVSGTGDVEEF